MSSLDTLFFPLQADLIVGIILIIVWILLMLAMFIAIVSLPFVLLYAIIKFLISDTFHEGTNKIEEKVNDGMMDVYYSGKSFSNSAEGQAALSVLESAAEQYSEKEDIDLTSHDTNTDRDATTKTSTQDFNHNENF